MGAGTGYKQAKLEEQWDAIVIGSGIGGLTAAALLATYGKKRVLVLERHYEAGGFTHTFHRPGYEWDVGLHYIGEMQDMGSGPRRAFDHVTGGGVEWAAMPEVYDRVLIEGRQFDFAAGVERFREGLKRWFPPEDRAIDRYIEAVEACNRASRLYYAEKAIPGPAAAVAGGLMRAGYMKWARRTTREVLESLTTNHELMGVLTAQWGDYGMPPGASSFAVHATIAAHYFAGASYPVGGASTIAAAITKRIEQNGSLVVTSAEVAGILVVGGKAAGVRMADGREFRAGLVVSDAGAANTFDRLLPADVTAVDGLRKQLRKLAPSTAHISLYLGLDASSDELGLKGTNLWVYPSYDHDENVKRFARDLDEPFPVVYISFPSAKDPSFASRYPGKSTIEAITMVPYEAFARWGETRWKRRGSDYDELKLRLTARLREEVERQVPAAVGHIAYTEISTPVTTKHFMNYGHGEIYGVSSSPERFLTRRLGARTPIRGLYLTGQDVASLGVVGALFGGVICASAALGRNLMSTVSKPFAAKTT
jgi:all-trans-retinol 13,14-reductase